MIAYLALAVLALSSSVLGDVYLQNPRGSNNRLSGNGANVDNNRRLFMSRNVASGANNAGGYNSAGRNRNMYYFAGSILPIEWTINNGCGDGGADGGDENSHHCDIVLQYMCSPFLRDGTVDQTIPIGMEPNTEMPAEWVKNMANDYKYGLHENWAYFDHCRQRRRNMGLYTGPRTINGNTARFTRTNPSGTQYGYECPEERDYYPYWSPTPWRDIAIITSDTSKCDYYKANSQNTHAKGLCDGDPSIAFEENCPMWKEFKAFDIEEPPCLKAPWIGENMLSNGIDGQPMRYNWTIPNESNQACAIRIRYNVSIGDFEGWNIPELNRVAIGAEANGRTGAVMDYNMIKPCCDSPGEDKLCQCGLWTSPGWMPFSVSEDRSHRFDILPRPETIKNTIYNLNVRGKRGNIVQTFPATEYDFVPNQLHCMEGEWMHIQWTGSDNNRNNVAGEGTDQTDRSNMIQIRSQKYNQPIDWADQTLFSSEMATLMAYTDMQAKESQCKTQMELAAIDNDNDREEDPANCMKLNPASTYFDGGLQPCHMTGVYHYISTRNNNFSNRGQKGMIIVGPCDGSTNCTNADQLALNGDNYHDPYDYESAASGLTVSFVAAALSAFFLF